MHIYNSRVACLAYSSSSMKIGGSHIRAQLPFFALLVPPVDYYSLVKEPRPAHMQCNIQSLDRLVI